MVFRVGPCFGNYCDLLFTKINLTGNEQGSLTRTKYCEVSGNLVRQPLWQREWHLLTVCYLYTSLLPVWLQVSVGAKVATGKYGRYWQSFQEYYNHCYHKEIIRTQPWPTKISKVTFTESQWKHKRVLSQPMMITIILLLITITIPLSCSALICNMTL